MEMESGGDMACFLPWFGSFRQTEEIPSMLTSAMIVRVTLPQVEMDRLYGIHSMYI